MVDNGHYGSISELSIISGNALRLHFHDYALLKAPRDLFFGMYTQMTARNYIRYIHMHSIII